MHTINPVVFQSEEGLVISGSPDDLMRLAEVLMLVAKHPKTVHITLTDSFANKIIIDPAPSQAEEASIKINDGITVVEVDKDFSVGRTFI